MLAATDCCILNGGSGAWAFEPLAAQLASAIGIEISSAPRRLNYVLQTEQELNFSEHHSFIDPNAIRLSSDKRLLAREFSEWPPVPTPETHLCEKFYSVIDFVRSHPARQWCLKYPTGCGASGHRFIFSDDPEPPNWPHPFIVQEFIHLDPPEVYRTYGAGGEIFGWMVRRFPSGKVSSPWVAHARGARYSSLGQPPQDAVDTAFLALDRVNLLTSFGCVDLLCRPGGEWLVLEVGTDGLFNHVDRELSDPAMEQELLDRVSKSFWKRAAELSP